MQPTWINQLGSQNPQFLRECRGRLKIRNVVAAIALSLIAQIVIVLWYSQPDWRGVYPT
ncbi:MAG: hypothetical protein F6K65_40795, partial [Moorea sp. SIO3C2]|nr:hypothetical protein [Moorena sp. SIO3C2]